MSELKVYKFLGQDEVWPNANLGSAYYLKSEADKVIAELEDRARHYPIMAALLESDKKEITELKDKLQAADEQIENIINSASSIMLFQDRVKDDKCAELRHQKYKRCLAMARWCIAEAKVSDDEYRMYWWVEWHRRWLEFAEKFKEGLVIGVDKAIGTDKTVVINHKEAK